MAGNIPRSPPMATDSKPLPPPPIQKNSPKRPPLRAAQTMPIHVQDASAARGYIPDSDEFETRATNSYGHHRQASVVHGNIQHSRNPSYPSASPVTMPLSPEMLQSQGFGGVGIAGDLSNSKWENADISLSLNSGGGTSLATIQDSDSSTKNSGDHKNHRVMHSAAKLRREPSHNAHSKNLPQDVKTVGEYALHHLFNSFVFQANEKIDQCIRNAGESDTPVEDTCGPGVDPVFDQLISALGHIAKPKPKPLIDTIMVWRRTKVETASLAKQKAPQSYKSHSFGSASINRNTESASASTEIPDVVLPESTNGEAILAERRAMISVYLVCRVLIEIFNQSTLADITAEMAGRLEHIVFGQLKTMDPDQVSASSLRMANWRIYSQLLGIMSEINFTSVTKRFVTEIAHYQRDDGRSLSMKDSESKLEFLIFGMRHMKIRTFPEEAWAQSCDFLLSVGELFISSHGQRVKQAYCQVLENFLAPIAVNLSSKFTSPKWKEFIDLLLPRVSQVITKPRHWVSAFPLYTILLCSSPRETFYSQWTPVVNGLPAKLKERPSRAVALQALCRLFWTSLFRYPEANNTLKRIDDVVRIALPNGRRTYLTTEFSVAEPVTQLIRMIGHKHLDFTFRNIIFPLLNSEVILSGREAKIEQMEPEKIVIGIRSFLAIMTDLDNGSKQPLLPQNFSFSTLPSAFYSKGLDLNEPKDLKSDAAGLLPLNVQKLSEGCRTYYYRFCQILGKITLLCDNTFGGQAALDEKFGSTPAPKTPISEAFNFGRRDDHAATQDQKQAFYDLLHVAVQALPRCLSDHIPFNSLINLLCTGTAHVQSNIAASSAESLKYIARQQHAQQVTIGFARFIFSFDVRYATMSDEGMLGPGHIESTLKVYVELIRIWIEEIQQRAKDASNDLSGKGSVGGRAVGLDLSSVFAHVDEIESHGLFFLCSQSRRVRAFAVAVLRLVTQFDKALGKEHTRIIRILEEDHEQVLNVKEDLLGVAERSRLQKAKSRNGPDSILVQLCSSDVSYESTLWYKLFPNLIRVSFETCPFTVTLGREIVCARLTEMQKHITAVSDSALVARQYLTLGTIPMYPQAPYLTSSESMLEQWKLYLIMACTTLTSVGAQSQSQLANAQHARKTSKGGHGPDKISSARGLFGFVIPLLSAGSDTIRNSIVTALGSINKSMYRTLLESLRYAVTMCNEEARIRIGTHVRTPSSPRRSRQTDRLRTAVTHVYKVTSHFLKEPDVYQDDWILSNLTTYTRDLRIFLSDAEVQNDLEFQKLRFHYCGLIEELFEGINKTSDPTRWMSFESRKSAFSLMEDWCGCSPNQATINLRETHMRNVPLSQSSEQWETRSTAAIEIDKRNLKMAALSAMASLCGGPIRIKTENNSVLQFDVRRMFSWIDIIFSTMSDKLHAIGRRALKNMITHNKALPQFLENSIEMCYLSTKPKALESWFEVVTQVLIENADYPLAFWRILAAVLYTLGDSKREIRMKSARLLRTLEERQHKNSRLEDFDISISDKTTAVYKVAQFETSRRLAQQHADLAFTIFSEFSLHFKNVEPDGKRNMVAAILPWVQTIELQIDPGGGPTANSYMLLCNLFEITIQTSNILPNEVQALWQALATGPHGGNVQLVLDFIINLCLERKEQNFVDYAKQIVVFLSSTLAGSKVIEFFLLQVIPKNMVHERKEPMPTPSDLHMLPYVADLGTVLPIGNKQAGLSLGQVSLIFLVDLMVAPVTLSFENAIKLLHVSLIFSDHYTLTVQEEAREMVAHLIHELVTSKIGDALEMRQSIEDFVEYVRKADSTVVWNYEDNNGGKNSQNPHRVPAAMLKVTTDVLHFFSTAYDGVGDVWSKEALYWATSCPVRHLACRSFQVFRCISHSLDTRMLADMLARLSNTIAEEETDYQTFSMEILTTLKVIIGSLTSQDLLRYPQLFWTTCACLSTIHEREFMESLGMLEEYLEKVDLQDPTILEKLLDSKPSKWEGDFDGLQSLTCKGLKSAALFERTLNLIHRLIPLPNHKLIGDGTRLLFTTMADLPGLLYQHDLESKSIIMIERASLLATAAKNMGCHRLADCFSSYIKGQYGDSQQFLHDIMTGIREYYFPENDVQSLIFLMGLLTNTTSWFRIHAMRILSILISDIDMRRPDVACFGPDLISPLLRLLHTDLCPQALEVMDHIIALSANPMERHHLRMSMASSTSSRAFRKEFERVQSLYGIPEPSGWSIPVPAAQSTLTRHNVHAVFYSCAETDGLESAHAPTVSTPGFHIEDFGESYFPHLRADTMKSVDTQNESNLGDLLQKLDSLDDFFDESEGFTPPIFDSISGPTFGNYTGDLHDASADIYDQQTAPLLRQSLGHTPSSSFHNGFSERLPIKAFHSSPLGVGSTSSGSKRMSMHARSVTSPTNNFYAHSSASHGQTQNPSVSIPNAFESDDEHENTVSDSEERLTTSASARSEGPFTLESVIRSGVRRLTSGSSASKERHRELLRSQHRAMTNNSYPRIPRVPPEYLSGANSMPVSPRN